MCVCVCVCVCMHGLLYEVNDAYSEVAIIMYTEFTSDLPLTDRWAQPISTCIQRIEYKLLLLAFKSVNNDDPSYLSDFLKFYIPSRQLHSSSDTRLLRIPSFCPKSFGQRKFSYQASVLWNSLPISLRHSNSTLAFKSALRMHLFPSL